MAILAPHLHPGFAKEGPLKGLWKLARLPCIAAGFAFLLLAVGSSLLAASQPASPPFPWYESAIITPAISATLAPNSCVLTETSLDRTAIGDIKIAEIVLSRTGSKNELAQDVVGNRPVAEVSGGRTGKTTITSGSANDQFCERGSIGTPIGGGYLETSVIKTANGNTIVAENGWPRADAPALTMLIVVCF